MLKWYISHLRKEYFRSPDLGKNAGNSFLIGFFIFLLMMFYALALGIFLHEILLKLYPNSDPVVVFNGILIFYFLVDIVMRFFLQNLPKMQVESYLHLPASKNSIVRFVVMRTLLGVFNFLTFKLSR